MKEEMDFVLKMLNKLKRKRGALVSIQKQKGNCLETQIAKQLAEEKLADVEVLLELINNF